MTKRAHRARTGTCLVCRAGADHNLCRRHLAELERAIAELPADLRDLQLVTSRQARGPLGVNRYRLWDGGFSDGALGDAPWDFAPGPADQIWALRQTLIIWVRHLAETRRLAPPAPQFRVVERQLVIHRNRAYWSESRAYGGLTETLAHWLLANIDQIERDQSAGQLFDELTGLHAENERWILGRAGGEVFAGRCDAAQITFRLDDDGELVPVATTCGANLFGHEAEEDLRCPACGTRYQLADRLATMRERQLNDQLARAHVIADALTTLELPLGRDLLRKWIERDQRRTPAQVGPACASCQHATCRSIRRPPIHQRGVDADGQPVYRVGDVRRRLEILQAERGPRLTA